MKMKLLFSFIALFGFMFSGAAICSEDNVDPEFYEIEPLTLSISLDNSILLVDSAVFVLTNKTADLESHSIDLIHKTTIQANYSFSVLLVPPRVFVAEISNRQSLNIKLNYHYSNCLNIPHKTIAKNRYYIGNYLC